MTSTAMDSTKSTIKKLRQLVRAAYTEGFADGMGDKPSFDTWDDSQTKMCLDNGFDLSDIEKIEAENN